MKTKNSISNLRPHAVAILLATSTAGCIAPGPLKPGRAITRPAPAGGLEQTLTQSQNPAQASKQDQETIKTRTYTLPLGSQIQESQIQPRPSGEPFTNLQTFLLSAPMPVTEHEQIRARTELGAAQKDTARELAAKLSSLKSIIWVGLGLVVLGIASFVWPPLKLLIGSVTTSAAITLGGLALVVLPTLVVGNELLILGGVALAVGSWFLAHRHGHLRATVNATKPATPGPKPNQLPRTKTAT